MERNHRPQDLTVLNLDPGLAFGTGMHPRLNYVLNGSVHAPSRAKRSWTSDAGSGILGIAAGRLGASQITGLDIDPQALIATDQTMQVSII